jgi:hypothetical protein
VIRAVLLLLALCCMAAPARAQQDPYENWKPSDALKEENSIKPPPNVRGSNNAAVAYYRAWDIPTRRESMALGELVSNIPDKPTEKLGADLREKLRNYQSYVEGVMQAAAMEDCDWGFDFSAGWDLLLPHLGHTRQSCRVLFADSRRCAEDGSVIGAVERIQAIFRISQHAAEGPILISSLVGAAIAARGCEATKFLIENNHLTAATAKMLLTTVRSIPRSDLFNVRAALNKEREITAEWIAAQCTSTEPGKDFLRFMGRMGGGGGGSPLEKQLQESIRRWSRDEFLKDLARADTYFDELDKAWINPDKALGAARIEELGEELAEGQWGVVAKNMTPGMGKVHATTIDLNRKLTRIEKQLAIIADPLPQPVDDPRSD